MSPSKMFSQRNNPYCELLQISVAKLNHSKEKYKFIRKKYEKIFGLDLETTSIGWAVVNEVENDSEKFSIVKMGVRVVPLTVDEQSNFEKGKSKTTNADRNLKHGMRLNLHRYKLRGKNLIEC